MKLTTSKSTLAILLSIYAASFSKKAAATGPRPKQKEKPATSFIAATEVAAEVNVTNSTGVQFTLVNTWNLQDNTTVTPTLTKLLGGMFFSDDGNDLFIVQDSERKNAKLIRLPVLRHNETNKIIGLDGTSEPIQGDYPPNFDLIRKESNSNILYSNFTSNKFGRASYNETTKEFTTVQNITLEKADGWGCFKNDGVGLDSCNNVMPYGFSFHSTITDPNDSNRQMMMITADNGIWMVPFIVNATTGDYEFGGNAGNATSFCQLEPYYPVSTFHQCIMSLLITL